MRVIVALVLAVSLATPGRVWARQDEAPMPAPKAEAPASDSGFSFSPDRWTVRDVMTTAEKNRLALLAGVSFLVLLFLWVADVLRPGGLSKNGRDVKPHPALAWAFAGFVVMCAAVFGGAILKEQAWVTGPDPDSVRGTQGLTAGVYGVAVIVSLGMIYLFARSAPKSGLVPGVMDLPIGLLCLALAAPIVLLSADLAVLLYERAMETQVEPIAHPGLTMMLENRGDPWVWALIAGAVIGAPIVEETIYRVFFQSAILKFTGSAWMAVVGSAGLFTAMHAIGPEPLPPYALAPIAVLGLSMGIAFERTRRLGVPIVMHAGFNAANIYLAMQTQG